VLGRSLARRVALRSPSGEIARDIGAVDGGGSSRLTIIPAIPPVGGLLGNGIVDSDVDPDVRKAGIAAQGADSPFLGSVVDLVKFLAELGGDGEIDHGRASHAKRAVGDGARRGVRRGADVRPARSEVEDACLTLAAAGRSGDHLEGAFDDSAG
jgi:hypothetical protein